MRDWGEAVLWVVYQVSIPGKAGGERNVVCEQGEWDTMERTQPGHATLLQGGISSEGEAERLARGTSGDARKGAYPKR